LLYLYNTRLNNGSQPLFVKVFTKILFAGGAGKKEQVLVNFTSGSFYPLKTFIE